MSVQPAPWQLEGHGYVLVFPTSRAGAIERGWVDAGAEAAYRGGPALLMVVDYGVSAVGPYRELLFSPGRFHGDGVLAFTVTRIAVSSMESAVGGRVNWGLPKITAGFAVDSAAGQERWTVATDDSLLADLTVEGFGPALPVPRALGKLTILQAGRLVTHIQAAGRVRPARARIHAMPWIPRLEDRPTLAFAVPTFRMVFPPAEERTATVAADAAGWVEVGAQAQAMRTPLRMAGTGIGSSVT